MYTAQGNKRKADRLALGDVAPELKRARTVADFDGDECQPEDTQASCFAFEDSCDSVNQGCFRSGCSVSEKFGVWGVLGARPLKNPRGGYVFPQLA